LKAYKIWYNEYVNPERMFLKVIYLNTYCHGKSRQYAFIRAGLYDLLPCGTYHSCEKDYIRSFALEL